MPTRTIQPPSALRGLNLPKNRQAVWPLAGPNRAGTVAPSRAGWEKLLTLRQVAAKLKVTLAHAETLCAPGRTVAPIPHFVVPGYDLADRVSAIRVREVELTAWMDRYCAVVRYVTTPGSEKQAV